MRRYIPIYYDKILKKIHNTLIFKSKSGYISSVTEFDTVVVDDTIILSLATTDFTTSSITVEATASSAIGIKIYEFKIGDETWVNNGTTNTYTFSDLEEDSSYAIYTRVTNNVGITSEENISTSVVTRSEMCNESCVSSCKSSFTGSCDNCRKSDVAHDCSTVCDSGSINSCMTSCVSSCMSS